MGRVDARPIASLRIGLSTLVLIDLAERLGDFHAFYTDAGLFTRGELTGQAWTLLTLSGSTTWAGVVFALAAASTLALLLGWRTRAAGPLALFCYHSIQQRAAWTYNGGDLLLTLLLAWLVFCDSGAAYSLDRRARPAASDGMSPALPVRALQLHFAFVYARTAWAKLTTADWVEGRAVWFALSDGTFSRPPGRWLTQWPALTEALTWLTIGVEAALPLLLLAPVAQGRPKAVGIALGTLLHLGITLSMRVGVFASVMFVGYLAFLEPRWLDAAERWLARRSALVRTLRSRRPPTGPTPSRPRALRWSVTALFAAHATLIVLASVPWWPRQHWLTEVGQRYLGMGQRQTWVMFAPPPRWEGWFQAEGVLTDGEERELLHDTIPEFQARPGWWYSRWMKLATTQRQLPRPQLLSLGRYLCRRWDVEHAPARVSHFVLVLWQRDLALPGEPPATTAVRHEMLKQRCAATQ